MANIKWGKDRKTEEVGWGTWNYRNLHQSTSSFRSYRLETDKIVKIKSYPLNFPSNVNPEYTSCAMSFKPTSPLCDRFIQHWIRASVVLAKKRDSLQNFIRHSVCCWRTIYWTAPIITGNAQRSKRHWGNTEAFLDRFDADFNSQLLFL